MKEIKQESGRSMVEMLGVLAIIGVLSVGGIAGYTLAMNKHRANSVVSDLMKRAVVISAQRQLGQDASLNGFNNQVGEYELDSTISEDNTNQTFGMTVKDVPQAVCQRILALSEQWKNASIQANCEQEKNNMIFIFNDDLSSVTGSNAGGEGTNTPQEPTCTGTSNGCQKCDATTGEWVADETLNDQSCGTGLICVNGECKNGCIDWTKNECGQGMFCNFTKDGSAYRVGSCTPLDQKSSKTVTVDGVEYKMMVRSDYGGTDWRSSYSWCEANGKRMVSLSDFGCSKNGESWGDCSSLGSELYKELGDEMLWTSDLYEYTTYYGVALDSGPELSIGFEEGDYTNAGITALCRDK